jgi:nucleoside-diphosphate-sugar epimerase
MKRLLIAGFGDIARRALPCLERRFEVTPLSRSRGFDLDRPPETLQLPSTDALLHCAPPPARGESDTRTANLLAALEKGGVLPARMVYVSTSGVYGDCGGARVDESHPISPQTDRGRRRVDAERRLAQWTTSKNIVLVVLRVPGIYAADRLPLARLRARTALLRAEDDVYTNHIHADDLAAIVCRAFEGDAPAGVYNAADDTELKMGDWLDLVADAHGLPRAPRVSWGEAEKSLDPLLLSFMRESRRLDNARLKSVLGVRLRYPTVYEGLKHGHLARSHQPA